MAKTSKRFKDYIRTERRRSSGNPMEAYRKRATKATKMLTKQFDIGQKKAAKLVSLFIQPPKAMGSGRPGERYYT